MKKLLIFSFAVAITLQLAAQKKPTVHVFLHGQASFMAYDQFIRFTGAGFGTGLQALIHIQRNLAFQADAASNLFPINKIAFILPDSSITGPKQSVTTFFAGLVYSPLSRLETGLGAGPAFHYDGTDIGIKPYIAFYLGKKKAMKAHLSHTHIFVRNQFYNSNTGIINAGLAIKLF